MGSRVIKTLIILLFTTTLWGQTAIRGTTKIETDRIISDTVNNSPNKKFEERIKIKPIDSSDYELEIRFYKHASLSDTRNLRIIRLKNGGWTALEYDERNKPVKIKKYTLSSVTGLEALTIKLLYQKLTTLPDQRDLKDKMKKFIVRNGRQVEKHLAVLDGYSYTVEFKIGNDFRIYGFDNPDSYARFYEDVEELKNYVAIVDLFEKELTRE